jgi:hypothetical protein
MKKLLITLVTLLFVSISYSQNIPSIKMPGHPRILLLKGQEEGIKQTIATNAVWKKVHQNILAECDKIITKPALERIQVGKRLLDKSRECIRRVFYLSYAWRMTHEEKYLKKAETELLTISAFSDWNPSHFLDVAEMTMGVAIGYDWLYNDISQSSRDIIREALINKGINQSLDSKYNSWLKVTNNWNQVCNAGMTYGALAVYEDKPDLAKQIIERALKSIQLPMEDFSPDGAYPEGYGYWGYGTSFNVMFISALEKIYNTDFGLAEKPGFLKTAGYLENMTGPSGKSFNYSDAGANGGINPAMFWFANRLKNNSVLLTEKSYLESGKSLTGDRLLPAIMIWGAGVDLDKINAPKDLIWVGKGKSPVALMRTSWNDPNAIFVGLKGGSPSVNHAHMDEGSFVMDAGNLRWAMDFGMQDYESLESKGVDLWNEKQNSQRWQVFRYNNFSHNTLTFNNELQLVNGYAPITGFTNNPSFLIAITDLTELYKNTVKSANRGIAIVDQKYVMVRDEIVSSEKETTVRWTMVTPAEVNITGNGIAELTQKGKKLRLQVVEPSNIKIVTWTTTPTHEYDAQNTGTIKVGFEVTIPANTKYALTVLLIPEDANIKTGKTIPSLSEWLRKE